MIETEVNDSGDEGVATTLPKGVDLKQIEAAVKALVKHAAKTKGDSLFLDAPVRILMDVKAFKTPAGKNHFYNISLPNTPHKEISDLDVLLIVSDKKDRDPDHVVGEFKDELMNSAVADKIKVREVMTVKQFQDDYSTFESKRALSKSVDVVIGELKVWKLLPKILGREFFKKKKFPMMIPGRKLKKNDLGEQILFALHKTVLNLSLTGLISTIVVGHDSLTEDQLASNAAKIVSWIAKSFPGGWENVQNLSLHVGQKNMPPLPIYFSTSTRNNVKKRPSTKGDRVREPEEDEVSTQLGKRIKVYATGEIKVSKSEDRDPLDDIL